MQAVLFDICQRLGVRFGSAALMRHLFFTIVLIVFVIKRPTLPFASCSIAESPPAARKICDGRDVGVLLEHTAGTQHDAFPWLVCGAIQELPVSVEFVGHTKHAELPACDFASAERGR